MAIKKYNPTTPGLRGMTVSTFEEITCDTPEKSLTVTLKKHAGRNVRGKITVRHRGGGYRPKYRIIDFKRDKDGVPGTVATVSYTHLDVYKRQVLYIGRIPEFFLWSDDAVDGIHRTF